MHPIPARTIRRLADVLAPGLFVVLLSMVGQVAEASQDPWPAARASSAWWAIVTIAFAAAVLTAYGVLHLSGAFKGGRR